MRYPALCISYFATYVNVAHNVRKIAACIGCVVTNAIGDSRRYHCIRVGKRCHTEKVEPRKFMLDLASGEIVALTAHNAALTIR